VDTCGKAKTSGGFLPGPRGSAYGGDGSECCQQCESSCLPGKHRHSSRLRGRRQGEDIPLSGDKQEL
jgi:hypothetical protein